MPEFTTLSTVIGLLAAFAGAAPSIKHIAEALLSKPKSKIELTVDGQRFVVDLNDTVHRQVLTLREVERAFDKHRKAT